MIRYLLLLMLTCSWAIPSSADEAENIKIVAAMVDAINDRDLDRLDLLIAPNVVRHSAATIGIKVTNLEKFKAM